MNFTTAYRRSQITIPSYHRLVNNKQTTHEYEINMLYSGLYKAELLSSFSGKETYLRRSLNGKSQRMGCRQLYCLTQGDNNVRN